MVYHVTDYVAETSHLNYVLGRILDDVDRCQEMINRISVLQPDDPVPDEVRDFIEYYTGCEGLISGISTAANVLGKILVALKNAVVKIYEILCDIFKMIFDTEYRVRRQFTELQRTLIQASADPEAVKRFESTPASVISQKDCIEAIAISATLINMMKLVAQSKSDFEIDNILDETFQNKVHIKFVKGTITEDFNDLVAQHWGSLAEAGWTLNNLDTAITRHIDCLTGFETLKNCESELKKEASTLKREIDKLIAGNTSMDMVRPLQMRVALATRLVKAVGESATILVKRTGAITTILRALHAQMVRVMEDLKEERSKP